MFTKSGEWIDSHKVPHTDPVFRVQSADLHRSSSEDFNLQYLNQQGSNWDETEVHTGESNNSNLGYTVNFWTNVEAAADPEVAPRTVLPVGGQGDALQGRFHAHNLSADYDGLTAEQAAEKHFKDVILGGV